MHAAKSDRFHRDARGRKKERKKAWISVPESSRASVVRDQSRENGDDGFGAAGSVLPALIVRL